MKNFILNDQNNISIENHKNNQYTSNQENSVKEKNFLYYKKMLFKNRQRSFTYDDYKVNFNTYEKEKEKEYDNSNSSLNFNLDLNNNHKISNGNNDDNKIDSFNKLMNYLNTLENSDINDKATERNNVFDRIVKNTDDENKEMNLIKDKNFLENFDFKTEEFKSDFKDVFNDCFIGNTNNTEIINHIKIIENNKEKEYFNLNEKPQGLNLIR